MKFDGSQRAPGKTCAVRLDEQVALHRDEDAVVGRWPVTPDDSVRLGCELDLGELRCAVLSAELPHDVCLVYGRKGHQDHRFLNQLISPPAPAPRRMLYST